MIVADATSAHISILGMQFFHFDCSLYHHNNRFYFGIAPQLVIFDLDILKQVLVKEFDSFMDRPVSYIFELISHALAIIMTCRYSLTYYVVSAYLVDYS